MSSDLRERLADLAEEAPTSVGVGSDLWRRGVRRHRRRSAAAVLASAAVILAVVAGAGVLGTVRPEPPAPADVPASQLHLPRTLHAPSPWADGTDEVGPPGPLSALSMAPRNIAAGLTGVRHALGIFGVSAVDGSTVFLDLPGIGTDPADSWLGTGTITLSPDGHKVAFVRYAGDPSAIVGGHVTGWDVYDTVTGKITHLRVPGMDRIRGSDVFEIRFSGDSRYLLTNYSPTGSEGSRDDALVVWDVTTGKRFVAEGTGHYWLPEPGSAPEGVVWSRNRQVFEFDPLTGERSTTTLPRDVVTASIGPDGHPVAYVGHRISRPDDHVPWHLFAGESWQSAERVRLDDEVSQILGWRSDHEVVVGKYRNTVQVVDLRTGKSEPTTLHVAGEVLIPPLYAADLWRNSLVETAPSEASDPRWWMRRPVWGAASVAALVVLLVVRRRRAGR